MTGKQFLRIVVLRTKIISISSLCIGTLYVLYSTGGLIIPNLVLMFCAALAVDMGTTAFNSYYDFVRKVDSKTHTKEKDKVLVHEEVKPGEALALSLVIGRPASVVVILLFGTAAYTPLILFTTGIFTLLPKEVLFSGIPAAVFSIIEYVRMLKRGFFHETKSSNIGGIVRIFAVCRRHANRPRNCLFPVRPGTICTNRQGF
jgi:4-hydroxybenzoate polyprenyltransferase